MKKILKYVYKYKFAYLFALLCMVIAIGLNMVFPLIVEGIVDDVIIGGNTHLLKWLLIGILIVGIGRAFTQYYKEYIVDCVSIKIASGLRRELYSHIQKLSMDYFDNNNTGELMARIKDDVDNVWNALGFVGMLSVEVIIHVVAVVYCMFRLSSTLAWIPLVIMIILGYIALFMEKKLNKVYGEISEENAKLTNIAEENLSGVRTVKAFAKEKYEIDKFTKHNKKYYELNMKQSKTLVKYNPLFEFVGKALPIVMAIVGGYMVIKGNITMGVLAAFIDYCTKIVWPMEMLGWLSNDMSSAIASFKKLDKIFKQKSSILEDFNAANVDNIKGNIEFENVSFIRDNKSILEDISFVVPAGKTLGIMGATGAGKSSIINLLIRFFDANNGTIKIDGVDIKDMRLKQLRSNIATVMQDVFLFSDSIEENIKIGQGHFMKKKDIVRASKLACADGFIEELPEDYSTIIGERGVGLSGGQKQRLSLARAIAKKSPILVLDDSTSALDMETEYRVQEALDTLKDTTKIIIAHRISAVSKADEIIFLENGRIKERGTHRELMEQKGLYYTTYQAQYGKVG